MKKLIFLLLGVFLLNSVPVYAGGAINPIEFEPVGGGKYIYCNNPEELNREDLADDGETPEYLMNNPGLGKDSYRLYITHFNRVERTVGDEKYPGEDVWFEAVFVANEDTEIKLLRTAFEIPENTVEFLNYEAIKTEESWSAIAAEASLRGENIVGLTSEKVYKASAFSPKTISIKKGERLFLSQFIENYSAVPYPKHVLMAADFEILSGNADLDVFAAKKRVETDGEPMYPDVNFDTCGFGIYKPGRTHKGIAESLPEMQTEIEYEVTDATREIPVTVKNQYYLKGNFVTRWVTNLNPQDDDYSKNLTDESNILKLTYTDDSKLSYYGEKVPEEERDNIWVFDTHHSDTREWNENFGEKENYSPNFLIDADKDNRGHACSMGNYGVTLKYNIKLKNSTKADKILEYCVSTASDVICETRDKNGELLGNIVCKERKNSITEECLARVVLLAGEVTEFSVGITLPVQNYGGLTQTFKIKNEKSKIAAEESKFVKPVLIKENNDISDYMKGADEKTKEIFLGNEHSIKTVKTDDGYVAYYSAVEGNPYNYTYYWPAMSRAFLLDENFNVIEEFSVGSPVIEMSVYGGQAYIKTIANGSFFIDGDGKLCTYDSYILPKSGRNGDVWAQDGKFKAARGDDEFRDVSFEGIIPPFAEKAGDIFYFAKKNSAGVSGDGIYWNYYVGKDEITNVESIDGGIKINGEELKVHSSEAAVLLNGEYLGFSLPCKTGGDEIFIPASFLFRKLGMCTIYNAARKNITTFGDLGVFVITPGEKTVLANGENVTLSKNAEISDGALFVPSEILKYFSGIEYEIKDGNVKIDGKVGKAPGDAEVGGDISVNIKKNTKDSE